MKILAIRTDKPEAEIYVDENDEQLLSHTWHAHKQLSVSILGVIEETLKQADLSKEQLEGLLIFKGPGSFTGLRIGCSVFNAMSQALHIPIVGQGGEVWLQSGLKRLIDKENDQIVLPDYGGEANITKPRK